MSDTRMLGTDSASRPPNLSPSTLMGFNPNMAMGGLAGLFGGLFGNSGSPYSSAMDQYQQWANKAQQMQSPFYQAGVNALPQYQNWLKSMSDPSGFINGLMGKYQQSPWAKYQTDQSMRAAQNMGSSAGLTGSTPLTQFAQQQAAGISSQDMQNWLGNVLGINTQYGAGEGGLVQGGQNSANALTNMYGQMAPNMASLAYGQQAGNQNDMWNMIGGGLSLAGAFL